MLPGPRPVLLLGRTDLLQVLPHQQEVTNTEGGHKRVDGFIQKMSLYQASDVSQSNKDLVPNLRVPAPTGGRQSLMRSREAFRAHCSVCSQLFSSVIVLHETSIKYVT